MNPPSLTLRFSTYSDNEGKQQEYESKPNLDLCKVRIVCFELEMNKIS